MQIRLWIRDGKSRIRDKQNGSATLVFGLRGSAGVYTV